MKIMLIMFLGFLLVGCTANCQDYSTELCPKQCIVCPPCKECSSISCETKEFCEEIGFNQSWYEEIKERLE